MAVKLVPVCLLAVAFLGSLGSAQYFKVQPTQEPLRPQPPQNVLPPVYHRPAPSYPQPQRSQDPQRLNPPVYPPPLPPRDPQKPSPPVFPQPLPPRDPQQPSPPFYPQPVPPRDPQQPSPPVYPQPLPPRDPQKPSPPVFPQPLPPRDPQKPSPPVYPQPVPPRDPQRPSQPVYPQPVLPRDPQKPSPPIFPQPVPPRDPQRHSPPVYPPPVLPRDPQKPSPPIFPQPVPPRDPYKTPTYQQNTQRPNDPQQPKYTKTPTQEFHTCEVEAHYKIQCGLPSITASECQSINCCFDGQMCYYGKAVTLQCTKDAQFILVVARDTTLPNIDLESIHFTGNDQRCQAADSTSAFAIFQFPVTSCGTTVTEDESGLLTYENRMSSSYEVAVGPYGAITRDSQFDLIIQCRYMGTSVEAFVFQVGVFPAPPPVAAPGPLRVALRLGNGQCTVKGCVEENVAYSSYYLDSDYPVTKVLRDPVYVEVRMLERTDPNLVLTLGRCWATSSPYPQSLPQWDLLIDGCPYRDDRYQTTLVSVGASSGLMYPTHYRRFIFKMFTFVASGPANPNKNVNEDGVLTPLKEKVYIHCNTAVCQPTLQNNCEPRCFRKRRDIAASVKSGIRPETTTVTSHGIIIMDPDQNIQ